MTSETKQSNADDERIIQRFLTRKVIKIKELANGEREMTVFASVTDAAKEAGVPTLDIAFAIEIGEELNGCKWKYGKSASVCVPDNQPHQMVDKSTQTDPV